MCSTLRGAWYIRGFAGHIGRLSGVHRGAIRGISNRVHYSEQYTLVSPHLLGIAPYMAL